MLANGVCRDKYEAVPSHGSLFTWPNSIPIPQATMGLAGALRRGSTCARRSSDFRDLSQLTATATDPEIPSPPSTCAHQKEHCSTGGLTGTPGGYIHCGFIADALHRSLVLRLPQLPQSNSTGQPCERCMRHRRSDWRRLAWTVVSCVYLS